MAKPLVIVESPAKAKTLARFLGDRYRVEASVGHIRDLPGSAREIPAEIKDKPWGRMAVDVDGDFRPYYVVPLEKKKNVTALKAALKDASEAPAGDRPGSRRRVDQLASARSAQTQGAGPPDRVPRGHRTGRQRGHRAGAVRERQSRPGAGEPADPRPALWLHPFAGPLEEGPDRVERGSRPERGGPAHRRA